MKAPTGRMRVRTAVLVAVAAIGVGGAFISPALGGPGFLTLKEAKRAFFTKKQANGRFLAKQKAYNRLQANARFLDQDEGDARYLGADATTRLQVSPSGWVADNNPTSEAQFSGAVVDLASGPNTSARFFADVTIPSLMHGRPVKIESFELCADAYADAMLDRVFLIHRPEVTSAHSSTGYDAIVDETDRTAYACRTYSAAEPIALGPNDTAQVGVQVAYSDTPDATLSIFRLTINLSTP